VSSGQESLFKQNLDPCCPDPRKQTPSLVFQRQSKALADLQHTLHRTLISASGLLAIGTKIINLTFSKFSYMWRMGYGAVTAESMVNLNLSGGGGLLVTVLLANPPQALLSFLFLTYNGL